jgi:Killing trait
MADPLKVNSQIIDSLVVTNQAVLGNAPARSQGVTLEAAAYAISLLMMNSVTNQFSGSQIANASVVSSCTGIIKAGAKAV